MRVLIVEDEPLLAEGIRDGLRLEAIAADIAGNGDTALELLSINAYCFESRTQDGYSIRVRFQTYSSRSNAGRVEPARQMTMRAPVSGSL